jgi:hypothetical protein
MNSRPNPAPVSSHSPKIRLPGFLIGFLILGAIKGWPLIFAYAQELIAPVPAHVPAAVQENMPAADKEAKPVSFDEQYKDWAMVMPLYETRITVHEDCSYESRIRRKVLIQTKDGNDMGEIPIYYDADTEEILDLRAVTITPDGKEYPPAKVQELTVHEGFGMYSGAKKKILSMPESTPGSMIELQYTKVTKNFPMPGVFWDIEPMEQAFPIKEQRIVYNIPTNLDVRFKSFLRNWEPVIKEKDGMTVYSWERKDYAPDLEPAEELLPPPTVDSISDGIEFSSIKSWKDVAVWYYGLIRKNLKITPEISSAASKAAKGKATVRDRTRAVLEYMQANLRYVSMAFGDHSMAPHPTDEVFRNKYGDCKDQSLLAKAMLEAVGVKADLVLLADEMEGNDPKEDLPLPGLYDHVLLKVYDLNEGDFYADPLLEGYDIGEYPMSYQRAHLFVITPGGGQFEKMPIFGEDRYRSSVEENIEIRPDGSVLDRTTNIWNLSSSIGFRKDYLGMNSGERKQFYKTLGEDLAGNGKMLKLSFEGLDKKYGPVKSVAAVERPEFYPVNDGLMVIDFPGESLKEGWSAKKRTNPIFFPVNSMKVETTVFKIPAGFEVMHLPKGFDLDNGFFRFRKDIERKGNTITVKETRWLRRVELPASEWPRLKEFHDKLPSRTEQRIILKKKESQ